MLLKFLMTALTVAFLSTATSDSTTFAGDKKRVDLLLVLASDVSYSVDEKEFLLQRQGYATALTSPKVLAAANSGRLGRIAITYFEWADPGQQAVILNWTIIHDRESAQSAADRLLKAPRSFQGWTAIGSAIDSGVASIENAPYEAERWVIDISGDGTSLRGTEVTLARDRAINKGITINALVVTSPTPHPTYPDHTHPPGGLTMYFEKNVIGGYGGFAHEIVGFDSFAEAIAQKMAKEMIASLDPP